MLWNSFLCPLKETWDVDGNLGLAPQAGEVLKPPNKELMDVGASKEHY